MMNRNTNNLLPLLGVQSGAAGAPFSQLAPAQLLMLHQQMNAAAGGLDLFAAAAAAQQQRAVVAQAPNRPTSLQEDGPRAFSSSFSVSSLLGNNSLPPFLSSSPEKPTLPAINNSQQQQLATALITQHLAAVMAHYRIQQQKQVQAFCQQQQQQQQRPVLYPLNESSFQPPPSKKQRSGEQLVCETLSPTSQPHEHIQMNSSVCSISSPSSSTSSSSSSSASAPQSSSSSSASSMLYDQHDLNSYLTNLHQHHLQQQQQQSFSNQQQTSFSHNLDYLARVSQSIINGSHHHLDSGAFSSSSGSNAMSSLNDSGEFGNATQNNSENHHPNDFSNRSSPSSAYQRQAVKRSNRQRNSFDLHNLSCPICGLTLRGPSQLQSHLLAELESLDRIKSYYPDLLTSRDQQRKRTLSGSERPSNLTDANSRYLNYVKIKESRELRLKNKLRLRLRESGKSLLKCPLCTESLVGCSKDQINFHFENCASLKPSSDRVEAVKRPLVTKSNELESVDDSNSFDSYEWSGHKRSRPNHPAEELTSEAKEEYEGDLDVGTDHEFQIKSEDKTDQARIAKEKLESSDSANSNEMVNSSESQMDNDLLNESRSSSVYAKDDDSGVNELSPSSNKNDQDDSTDDIKSSQLRNMINKAEKNRRCLICTETHWSATCQKFEK